MTDLDAARRAVAAMDAAMAIVCRNTRRFAKDNQAHERACAEAAVECIALVRSLAPGGEVVAWQRRYKSEYTDWSRWSDWDERDRDEPFPKMIGRWTNEYRPLYTHPPTNPEGNV